MILSLKRLAHVLGNEMWGKTSGVTGFSLRIYLCQFRKDERGSMMVLSIFLFIIMLMVGGVAIDTMRAEQQRTKTQYTLDRAIIAAASLKQTIPAQDVVADYFDKAGLGTVPSATQIEEGLNQRSVFANTPPQIDTAFINMLDIGNLATPASGTTMDRVQKVEISLVLDVSGSMNSYHRLHNLKVAAKEFVDTILLNQPEDDTYSISIIPFSTQVTAGQTLLAQYNVTSEHSYSHCVDFDKDDFNTAAISTSDELQRSGHFAPWSDSTRKPVSWSKRACAPVVARNILPLSGDIPTLKAYIDNLTAAGWTSGDVGIKWGAALLDPSAQSVVSGLVSENAIDAKFDGRPYNYDKAGVQKVIVMMTDGDNRRHRKVCSLNNAKEEHLANLVDSAPSAPLSRVAEVQWSLI